MMMPFRTTNKFILFALGLLIQYFISSCTENNVKKDGFSELNPSISYRLDAIGDAKKKISEGDFIFLKAVFKTEKDSVFWDWKYNAARKYYIKASSKRLNSDLLGFLFKKYNPGDSLSLRIGKTTFFREFFDTISPWFLAKDSFVKAELQIEQIMNEKEFSNYMVRDELKTEAEKWGEGKIIADYVLTYFNFPEKADSLLYYEKTCITNDTEVRKGKTITCCYTGTFMDSVIFDDVKPEKPTVINFGYEGQMLPGIELVMKRLRKGESAKIIIPSQLGFGEEGSSNGTVPPNATLLYKIKIIDVK